MRARHNGRYVEKAVGFHNFFVNVPGTLGEHCRLLSGQLIGAPTI